MDVKKLLYQIVRTVIMSTVGLVKPFRIVGRENIPEGAAILCGNHSSALDPFYMAYATPPRYHVCFMAKRELFQNKLLGGILRAVGTFPVNREAADIEAIKSAMKVLKSGKKLGIFPEGTRTAQEGTVSAKAGAIRLAEKMGAPLVPIYIPRKKPAFKRATVVVGKPYRIEGKGRLSHEEMERLAGELMNKIEEMGHHTVSPKGA